MISRPFRVLAPRLGLGCIREWRWSRWLCPDDSLREAVDPAPIGESRHVHHARHALGSQVEPDGLQRNGRHSDQYQHGRGLDETVHDMCLLSSRKTSLTVELYHNNQYLATHVSRGITSARIFA